MEVLTELFDYLLLPEGHRYQNQGNQSKSSVNEILDELRRNAEWPVKTERVPSFADESINPDDLAGFEPPCGRIIVNTPKAEPTAINELIDATLSEYDEWGFVRINRPEPFIHEWIVARKRS